MAFYKIVYNASCRSKKIYYSDPERLINPHKVQVFLFKRGLIPPTFCFHPFLGDRTCNSTQAPGCHIPQCSVRGSPSSLHQQGKRGKGLPRASSTPPAPLTTSQDVARPPVPREHFIFLPNASFTHAFLGRLFLWPAPTCPNPIPSILCVKDPLNMSSPLPSPGPCFSSDSCGSGLSVPLPPGSPFQSFPHDAAD